MNTYLKTIEPHLLTDDSTVQRSIMHSLQEYPNIPVEWTSELLKKSMESKQADSDIIINLESATFDRNAVVQLIRVLENAKSNVIHIYKGLFHQIEPELLIEFKKQLSPYIPDEEWEFYQFLVDCEDRQEAEYQYDELIDRLEMERFDQNLFDKGKRLIDLFSKRRWLDEWEIENTVKENLEFDYFVYLGIYAVYAMGLSRNPKWIPYLVRLLDREEDILVEEASKALIGYQSDDVIKAVRPLCLSDDFIFPIGVVNDTRTPFAVESLIELYHQVDEDAWDAKELIVEGLCHQFSPKALPIIAEHMENSFATGLVDLEAEVYGTFAVLGAEHEGLNEWKRIAEEREQRFQSTMENDLKSLVNRKPIVTEKKVGRNAPCPCGSGKKYKKCCGN